MMIEQGKLVNSRYSGTVRNLFIATVCACLSAFAFGYVIGYSSPVIPLLEGQEKLNSYQATWFASLIAVGGLFGGPIAGWALEKIGRKYTIMATSVPLVLGWSMIYYASEAMHFYAGRFLTGIASAMVTVCVPIYIAEIATKELRGMLGAGCQFGITVGILVVQSLGLTQTWEYLTMIGLIISIIAAAAMIFMPETPRYLLMRNRKGDALQSLAFLRGPHADVQEECRDIEEGLTPQDDTFAWSELWKPEILNPLKVSVALMIFQQFSGINVVMFYTVSIFRDAGFKESGDLPAVIVAGVQVVATLAACILMDRSGRRSLLLLAGAGMTLTCVTFGIHHYIMNLGTTPANYSWLAVGSLVGYIISFSLGWGPIPMLVMSEIFPVRARGTASAIAIFANWSCAFIVTKSFQSLIDLLSQAGAFWFFAACNLTGIFYVWKNVPETKGKSLEDIELYFLGRALHTRGV